MQEDTEAKPACFKISKLSVFITLLTVYVGVMGEFYVQDFPTAWFVGLLVGVLVLSVISGIAIYRLTCKKSKPANLSYCLTLLLSGWIVLTVASNHYKSAAQHLAPLEREEVLYQNTVTGTRSEDNRELLERSLAGEDVTRELADLNRQQVDAMHARAEDVGDVEGNVLRVLAAMKQRMGESTQARITSLNAFINAGGIDPTGLKEPKLADVRLRLLNDIEVAVESQIQMISNLDQQVAQDLLSTGVPESLAEDATEGVREGLSVVMVDEFLAVQKQAVSTYRELITFYIDYPEVWRIDQDTDQLLILDDAAFETHQRIVERIDSIVEKEQDIQRRIVESSKE